MTAYQQNIRVSIGKWAEVSASGNGTSVTYTYTGRTSQFAVGDTVVVTGLGTGWDGTFTVTVVTSSTFRVTNTKTGSTATLGLAYVPTYYDYTLIDSLQITGGRSDVTAPVSPMTASVDIHEDETTGSPLFNLNDLMIAQVYDYPTTTWTTLFTGFVTDETITYGIASGSAYSNTWTINAASVMSKLDYNSFAYSGSSPIVTSGSTAFDWINQALTNDNNTNGYFYGTISADTIVMHKRVNGTYTTRDICETAAGSARGNFHDRPDGRLYYTPFSASTTPTFYDIGEAIVMIGASVTRSITEVYNYTQVTTTNAALTTGTSSNTTSQSTYGKRIGTRSTELASQALVNSQATDFNTVRRNPKWRPGGIVIDLALTDLTDADRTQYYTTRTNTAYALYNVVPGTQPLNCLVDNWQWSFSRNRAQLALQLCPFTDLHP